MFCFLLSLGAACGNVCPSPPDGRHDAQLLGDFLERGVLREPLESVYHSLLIRHGVDTTASQGPVQEARSSPAFIQTWAVPPKWIDTALPELPRGAVGHASSLVPLADGRIHKRQCMRHPRNGGRFFKATSARRAGYVQCE